MTKSPHHLLSFILIILISFSCTKKEEEDFSGAPEVSTEWEEWIQQNSYQINPPNSTNFSDLLFLQNIIGNKEIVQLGESSHGVREFNSSKVRMIKFLHEHMDFNVLAFESSIFECFYAFHNKLTSGSRNLMKKSIYGVWHTEEVIEVFEYIIETQNTANPLILAGFDVQSNTADGIVTERWEFLKEVISNLNIESGDSIYRLEQRLPNILKNPNHLNEIKDDLIQAYNDFYEMIDQNMNNLIAAYPDNPNIPLIAKVSIRSIMKKIDMVYYHDHDNDENYKKSIEIRDEGMAYNASYLKDQVYPDEKMIIWAHNFHIRYNNMEVENTSVDDCKTMGYYLQNIYGNNIYTIGFYMYSGELTNNDRSVMTVTPATSENVESILYRTNHKYAFVDLLHQSEEAGNSWMFNEMYVKFWGGKKEQSMIIRDQYDGIFYVEETNAPIYIY